MNEEKMNDCLKQLPEASQLDELNLAELHLHGNAKHKPSFEYKLDWSEFSLSMALRENGEEHLPTYSSSDLKALFS